MKTEKTMFQYKRNLAQSYFPEILPESAVRRLDRWIIRTRNLILEEISAPIISPTICPIRKRQKINGKISSIILSEWVIACNPNDMAEAEYNG